MAIQLYITFKTEGKTDIRFLGNIIEQMFLEIAYTCPKDISVESIQHIDEKKDTFIETMLYASELAYQRYGASILCIHADADQATSHATYHDKINSFLSSLHKTDKAKYCHTIVPIVPVQMTEAWMLADMELLKDILGATKLSDADLELHRKPEQYADPKAAIENAIRITAQRNTPKKRRNDISIADLYSEISRRISLDKLRNLSSFRDFENNAKEALRTLNYL